MNPEDYWNVKMTQYVKRFTTFRTMMTQAGITDKESIQEHWELFADNFCGCESCADEDEDDVIEINIPTDYPSQTSEDEDWDDETPAWR